jgi:repressor LexA
MPDFSQLTDRQREIYEFIRDRIFGRGYGPTVREIGEAFEIKSPNGVMCHLKALEKKGLIKKEGRHARAIQLVEHRPPSIGLPFLGSVAAGIPIEAIDQAERIQFDDLFVGANHFILKVRGESMIEDHIEDGDLVVIRKVESPDSIPNGERVVVMVDGASTLKRFYREPDHIRLEPANKDMAPIIIEPSEDPQIVGVLVGVMRKC